MKKVTAIIQARLGSTRLPGKTLMKIEGESLLGHLVARVSASNYVSNIIIATTEHDRDDEILEFAKGRGLICFRGSEEDVLDRFYKAAVKFKVEHIVRITPDCPMLDPAVMDLVISTYVNSGYDYVSNTISPTYPDGLDTEVFSFDVLDKVWKEARLPSEREHVTAYIVKHPELFKMHNVKKEGDGLSWMRWTVDTERDFEFVKKVFSKLYKSGKIFFMDDIVNLLINSPELMKINKGISRNEGYQQSVLKDHDDANI
jgi:spore coat polysaccharide biosynthesis protein SpsF